MFTSLEMHLSFLGSPAAAGGMVAMWNILNLCDLVRAESTVTNLIQLLRETNNFRVSDPRDKVIGILGLIKSPFTKSRLPYLADDTLTVDQVYWRLAVHLFELRSLATMLSHAGLHRRSCITKTSSWAPDWTAQFRSFGPLLLVSFRPNLYQAATGQAMRGKTLGIESVAPGFSTFRILALAGDIVDEVMRISHPRYSCLEESVQSGHREFARFALWLISARVCIETAFNTMGLKCSFNEHFARTLLIDNLCTDEITITAFQQLPMSRSATRMPVSYSSQRYGTLVAAMTSRIDICPLRQHFFCKVWQLLLGRGSRSLAEAECAWCRNARPWATRLQFFSALMCLSY